MTRPLRLLRLLALAALLAAGAAEIAWGQPQPPIQGLETLSPEERAQLLRAIDEGASDLARGDAVDGREIIARLRAAHEAASR